MAGDIETAKRYLRRACYERGLCVTVGAQAFIYTGGEEAGFSVGLVNYPRFPSTPESMWGRAKEIAEALIRECCQRSALVVAADRTEWLQVQPPGAQP
jgi:hypothetical protein